MGGKPIRDVSKPNRVHVLAPNRFVAIVWSQAYQQSNQPVAALLICDNQTTRKPTGAVTSCSLFCRVSAIFFPENNV